jgi:hypothetical protein
MSAEELLGAAAGRQRRTVAASLVAAGREGRASDEKVTLVGNRVHAVRRDVLRMRMSASAVCPICISEAGAYVAFLGEMSLDAFIEDELRVKVVEEALERADASFRRYDLIPPRLGDDVQNFRVQVVEAAVATDGGTGESDERTGREGVFGRPLVQRRLVVVRDVHQERVRLRSRVRDELGFPANTLDLGGRPLGKAVRVHRACRERGQRMSPEGEA